MLGFGIRWKQWNTVLSLCCGSFLFQTAIDCLATIFSKTLARNGSLEKLLKSSKDLISREYSFRRDRTLVFIWNKQKQSGVRNSLQTECAASFRNLAGSLSRAHEGLIVLIISARASIETELKCLSEVQMTNDRSNCVKTLLTHTYAKYLLDALIALTVCGCYIESSYVKKLLWLRQVL